jgi:hypothetical protein
MLYIFLNKIEFDKAQFASLLIILYSTRHRHEKSITSIVFITVRAHLLLLFLFSLLYDGCLPEKQFAMKATAMVESIDIQCMHSSTRIQPSNTQRLIYQSACMYVRRRRKRRRSAHIHTHTT